MSALQRVIEVRLSHDQLGQLERWAVASYPREACGMLTGRRTAGVLEIAWVTEARNQRVDRPEDRYELAPEDFLAEDRRARGEGLEVLGFWHSHPDHPAQPSSTDLVAAWPGYVYVIVSATVQSTAGASAWVLRNGELVEVELAQGIGGS